MLSLTALEVKLQFGHNSANPTHLATFDDGRLNLAVLSFLSAKAARIE